MRAFQLSPMIIVFVSGGDSSSPLYRKRHDTTNHCQTDLGIYFGRWKFLPPKRIGNWKRHLECILWLISGKHKGWFASRTFSSPIRKARHEWRKSSTTAVNSEAHVLPLSQKASIQTRANSMHTFPNFTNPTTKLVNLLNRATRPWSQRWMQQVQMTQWDSRTVN